jgi:CxxC-x17-CxxC domain-containing protein
MPSDFVDRILLCQDCGQEFVFTAGEQIFFFEKQFKNDPKRCKGCKAKRASRMNATSAPKSPGRPMLRTETRTSCSACGIDTTVPFKPTQGRPVLCRKCFQLVQANPAVPAALAVPAVLLQAESGVSPMFAAGPGVEATGLDLKAATLG